MVDKENIVSQVSDAILFKRTTNKTRNGSNVIPFDHSYGFKS